MDYYWHCFVTFLSSMPGVELVTGWSSLKHRINVDMLMNVVIK